jgi:DnaD/phage-associated family protein
MNEKWIKIHNKFLNWEWYTDVNTKAVFIHCILKANWKDCSYQGIVVPRGSFVTGRKKLVKELGLSEQEIRTAIKHLISTNEITTKSTNKFTIISVNNYDMYQQNNQELNQQLTNNQPTTNQQLTTIVEYKNNRIIDNIYSYIEQEFGRLLSPTEYEYISHWEDNEITRYAIKNAVLNGAYNLKYVNNTLENWKKKNLNTLQKIQEDEKNFKKNKNKKETPVPEWYGKEIEKTPMDEEEEENLKELLKEFK